MAKFVHEGMTKPQRRRSGSSRGEKPQHAPLRIFLGHTEHQSFETSQSEDTHEAHRRPCHVTSSH